MWFDKKYVIYVSFIIIAVLLILLFPYKNSLDPNYIYLSIFANVIVILLMLVTIILTEDSSKEHINSVERSARKQIESWEKWDIIQRKQFLKSLIKELKFNADIYEKLSEKAKGKDYPPQLNNFILVSIEKSLYNTPTDIELINSNLLALFYNMKIHDNKLKLTRMPGIQPETIEWYIKSIGNDYEIMAKSLDLTINLLEEYEQGTEIVIM